MTEILPTRPINASLLFLVHPFFTDILTIIFISQHVKLNLDFLISYNQFIRGYFMWC